MQQYQPLQHKMGQHCDGKATYRVGVQLHVVGVPRCCCGQPPHRRGRAGRPRRGMRRAGLAAWQPGMLLRHGCSGRCRQRCSGFAGSSGKWLRRATPGSPVRYPRQ